LKERGIVNSRRGGGGKTNIRFSSLKKDLFLSEEKLTHDKGAEVEVGAFLEKSLRENRMEPDVRKRAKPWCGGDGEGSQGGD